MTAPQSDCSGLRTQDSRLLNSLFWKILRVTSLNAIFCEPISHASHASPLFPIFCEFDLKRRNGEDQVSRGTVIALFKGFSHTSGAQNPRLFAV